MLCGYQNCFGNGNENENYNVENSIAFVRIKMKVEPGVKPVNCETSFNKCLILYRP